MLHIFIKHMLNIISHYFCYFLSFDLLLIMYPIYLFIYFHFFVGSIPGPFALGNDIALTRQAHGSFAVCFPASLCASQEGRQQCEPTARLGPPTDKCFP